MTKRDNIYTNQMLSHLTVDSVFVHQRQHRKRHVLLHPEVCWDVAQCSALAKTEAVDWWTGSSSCIWASYILHQTKFL